MAAFAGFGLVAALASLQVHHQLLVNPLASSACDINSTISCSEAYTSPYGMLLGVPTALVGAVYFATVLGLIALCTASAAARAHLPGYVFALATAGLAGVLYFAYASFVVLKAVCLLCVGSYIAVIGLFLLSGAAAREPMSRLPVHLADDIRRLLRTPVAAGAALAFVAAAAGAVVWFPMPSAAAAAETPGASAPGAEAPGQGLPAVPDAARQDLERYLAAQQREAVQASADGAAVVVVKFNDYQCPPCGITYREYKPVFDKWAKQAPGKVKFVTKDFPLEPECNSQAPNGSHIGACEAAAAVRLAREKGKSEPLEAWLFANQPTLSPVSVREAARMIGGVTDFDARYARTLDLVKADIAQGVQLRVEGTPTFFMNGIRLPGLRAEFFDAAIAWELKRVGAGGR